MAEAQANKPGWGDQVISMLGGLVIGVTTGGTLFGLALGYDYAAQNFLNVYPPDDQTIANLINLGYALGPTLIGLLAGFLSYRWLLKLP